MSDKIRWRPIRGEFRQVPHWRVALGRWGRISELNVPEIAAVTILLAFLAFLLWAAYAAPAGAAPYVAAGGGFAYWPSTGNEAELEAGSEAGPVASLAVGVARPHWRAEVELTHARHNIHGVNGNGCAQTSCSADHLDGNILQATALTAAFYPELALGPIRAYAGGGLGLVHLTAFSDDALAPAIRAGAGLVVPLTGALSLDLSYRALAALTEPELDGQRTEFLSHGPLLRFAWAW